VVQGDGVGDELAAVGRHAVAGGELAGQLRAADGEVDMGTGLGRPVSWNIAAT
jgi:hypothetical protein